MRNAHLRRLFIIVCSACAAANGSKVVADEVTIQPVDYERYYLDWYGALLSAFDTEQAMYGGEHERFRVIVHPTFNEVVLVAVERRPNLMIETGLGQTSLPASVALYIAVYDSESMLLDEWTSGEYRGARHVRVTKDVYSKEIEISDFRRIFDAILAAGVGSEPKFESEENCPTDGARYFIELAQGEERIFITRGNCADSYKADFNYVRPLFDFALQEIPEVGKHITKDWLGASSLALE